MIGLMLRTKAEGRERTHRQRSLLAGNNLEIVYGEKFVSVGKIMIEAKRRQIARKQSRNISYETPQSAVRGVKGSRRVRVRVVTSSDCQRDRVQ